MGMEEQINLPVIFNPAERGRKLGFGASRGLQDRESIRRTAQLLADTFKNQLMQKDRGQNMENTINYYLNSDQLQQAAQLASEGVQILKDDYKIYIG